MKKEEQTTFDLISLSGSLDALREYIYRNEKYWCEAGHANRWWVTYNAALTGLIAQDRVEPDYLHEIATTYANLAHGKRGT